MEEKRKRIISYIDAMKEASSILSKNKTDFIVAPMMGSVPFIDAMAIVDQDFDPSKVVYMPASSRIENITNIISNWYYNFTKEKTEFPFEFLKVMGLDEVVSGSSVVKCIHSIDKATNKIRRDIAQNTLGEIYSREEDAFLRGLRKIDILTENEYSPEIAQMKDRFQSNQYITNKELAKEDSKRIKDLIKTNLEKKLIYTTIGIEDSKSEGKRHKEYLELKENKRAIPVKVESIITMDNPKLCPPRYKTIGDPSKEYSVFSPEIIDFKVTQEYLEFLSSLAKEVGKDPSKIYPVNMNAILDSKRYLTID